MQAGQGKFDLSTAQAQAWSIAARQAKQLGTARTSVALALVVAIGIVTAAGCSCFQLPAIDPNGSSVFLPLPTTTQLAVPRLHSRDGQAGLIPTPAFASPAMPPPCLDGSGQASTKHHLLKEHKLASKIKNLHASPSRAGEIQLTPMLSVAPVGGEVVLLAGLCGPDGYFVKRQPLEWMLSPDSVGQFIEVGDDAPGQLISTFSLYKAPKVEKLDVDFARGRTSSKATLITRGTPECSDDIQLKDGQTWLSISSPSEGVSRVTVLAPESEIWDRRRQTATIYWVDAQWEFPPPRPAQSGQTLDFVTRVTRSERLVPAENWIVAYTIVDPSVATFVPDPNNPGTTISTNQDGQPVAATRVNASGMATARVAATVDAQGQPARGTTPILIDVIRPEQPSDNMKALKLGSGQTFATFSSPGLNLQAFGVEVGSVGEQMTYVASLGNPGDVPAENAQLVMNIPVGTRLISAIPQPSTTTNTGLVWDQGVLDAHRQLDVSVVLEAIRSGTFDVVFQAQAAGNLTAASTVRTEIVDASVDLKFQPAEAAAQAEIGQIIAYDIDITNTSRQTLTDVKVLIESDPGLPEQEQGINKVEQAISYLQPGQTQKLRVNFIVRQEGQLAAKVRVYAGQNLLGERAASILGVPPRPKKANVGLRIDMPERVTVGEKFNAFITLSNSGEARLTGLDVELVWDPALQAVEVGNDSFARFRVGADNRSAVWSAQDLMPPISSNSGDVIRQLKIAFLAVSPAPQAAFTVRVAAAEGVQASDSKAFQVVTNSVMPPTLPPATGGTPTRPPVIPPPAGDALGTQTRTGNWEIDLADWGDPTIVGNKVRYTVAIRNNQNMDDREVRVDIRYSQGVNFDSATNLYDGTPVATEFGADGTLRFAPIRSVRAGEAITYMFILIPQIPNANMVVDARVYSPARPDPQEDQETTTVQPRN